ncbi:DNA-binding protein Ikaros-like [Ptychodera flava]|uniref:DNA-binding protein Ikaros-like n=1 Tax=Ptychodera flava TaxID=63121 RepID=UPI00396A37EE
MLASKRRMIRMSDNAPRPYKCTVCPQAFKQKGHLHQHMRIHTGVKPYRCDLCGYASTIRGNLTSHIKLRHSNNNHKLRKFRCPHCGLYFKFFDSLTVHIASRHNMTAVEKPVTGQDMNMSMAPQSQGDNQQMQQQHQQQQELFHQGGMPMAMNVITSQPEAFSFPGAYNIPHSSSTFPEPTVQMGNQSQDSEVQQWEVINNSNIEARNESTVETEAHPVSMESDSADLEVKAERRRFASCEQQADEPGPDSAPVSIGYSPASIQQKLKYSSHLRAKDTSRDVLDKTGDEKSGGYGDVQDTTEEDAAAPGQSFDEDEQRNSSDGGVKVNNITSTTPRDTLVLSADNSQADVVLVEKSGEVPSSANSKRSAYKRNASSPAMCRVDVQATSNFGGRSATPVSPLSLSHHSINSPGVHIHSSSTQPIPSPSTSSLPTSSPSRKLANKRSKFQNKDSLQCEFCDIVFGDTVMHTIHMGWHSHHHPFQCGVCGQQCKDKYDFMCHFTRGHDS